MMSLLLFVLGGLSSVGGIALSIAGLNLHDATVDAGVLTPGAIMTVGGFLLVGIGALIRELRQFGRAGTGRFNQAAPNLAAPAGTELLQYLAPDTPSAEARSADLPAPAAPAVAKPGERPRIKFPALVQADVPSNGHMAATVAGDAGADHAARGNRGSDGVGNGSARKQARKPPLFNTLWPKARDAASLEAVSAEMNGAASEPVFGPPPAEEPTFGNAVTNGQIVHAPERMARTSHAAAPLSVLKSGVIDGMAYTLYSDGSIAASLPQGVLRFGSISELREHIENAS
jgi:hypothetical protein